MFLVLLCLYEHRSLFLFRLQFGNNPFSMRSLNCTRIFFPFMVDFWPISTSCPSLALGRFPLGVPLAISQEFCASLFAFLAKTYELDSKVFFFSDQLAECIHRSCMPSLLAAEALLQPKLSYSRSLPTPEAFSKAEGASGKAKAQGSTTKKSTRKMARRKGPKNSRIFCSFWLLFGAFFPK